MFRCWFSMTLLFFISGLSLADSINISIKFRDSNGNYTQELPSGMYVTYVLHTPVFNSAVYAPSTFGFIYPTDADGVADVNELRPTKSYNLCINASNSEVCQDVYGGTGAYINHISITSPTCDKYKKIGKPWYSCDHDGEAKNILFSYMASASLGETVTDPNDLAGDEYVELFKFALSNPDVPADYTSHDCNYNVEFDYDMPPPESDDSTVLYDYLYNNVPSSYLFYTAEDHCYIELPDGTTAQSGVRVELSNIESYRNAYRTMVERHLITLQSGSSQWHPPEK